MHLWSFMNLYFLSHIKLKYLFPDDGRSSSHTYDYIVFLLFPLFLVYICIFCLYKYMFCLQKINKQNLESFTFTSFRDSHDKILSQKVKFMTRSLYYDDDVTGTRYHLKSFFFCFTYLYTYKKMF